MIMHHQIIAAIKGEGIAMQIKLASPGESTAMVDADFNNHCIKSFQRLDESEAGF